VLFCHQHVTHGPSLHLEPVQQLGCKQVLNTQQTLRKLMLLFAGLFGVHA
jgi:hypothetical protein